MRQMAEIAEREQYSVIGVDAGAGRQTSAATASSRPNGMSSRVGRISRIVEKPQPGDDPVARSRVVGRYVLTPRIFHHLRDDAAGRRRRDPADRRHRAAARGREGARATNSKAAATTAATSSATWRRRSSSALKHPDVGDRLRASSSSACDDVQRAALHRRRRAGNATSAVPRSVASSASRRCRLRSRSSRRSWGRSSSSEARARSP